MSKMKLKKEFAKKTYLVLGDELQPQVGSGHRYVDAVIGRKWVRVRGFTIVSGLSDSFGTPCWSKPPDIKNVTHNTRRLKCM